LREGQAEKLLETREALDLVLAAVRTDAATKRRKRKMARQLCENQLARVGLHRVKPQPAVMVMRSRAAQQAETPVIGQSRVQEMGDTTAHLRLTP
jgi:hypothetical protein